MFPRSGRVSRPFNFLKYSHQLAAAFLREVLPFFLEMPNLYERLTLPITAAGRRGRFPRPHPRRIRA